MVPITATTCVDAWLQACAHLQGQRHDDFRDYRVLLEIANPLAMPPNDLAVVHLVDSFLSSHKAQPFNSVVNTIFPANLYRKHGASLMFKKYIKEVYPVIKAHPDFNWGTYAHRMFIRNDTKKGGEIRPLADLIAKLKNQVAVTSSKRAAYELSTIDPFVDIPTYEAAEDRGRIMGGPCLTHVSFKLTADKKLNLDAYYRSHYYIERALPNLIGLAYLLDFVAREAGTEAGSLFCNSSMAIIDIHPSAKDDRPKWSKKDVDNLLDTCSAAYAGEDKKAA